MDAVAGFMLECANPLNRVNHALRSIENLVYVTRVSFAFEPATSHTGLPSADVVSAVLGTWRMNGQVCGREWPIYQEGKGYAAIVLTPERNSLEPGFNSAYVTKEVARAEAQGWRISHDVLGEDVESAQSCSCHSPGAYALFTTYVSMEPTIRCMDCFHPVPLYRMKPMASGEFYELINWQSNYQSSDRLQMNCTVLERAGTREISALGSNLSKSGLEICSALAASSGRPFYYYLFRGHGRSYTSEIARRCPGCGGEWHLPAQLHHVFDFRCDHCHLLSNIAFDVRHPSPS